MFVKFNVFDARLILETVKSHKTTNQSLSGCFITYWQYKGKNYCARAIQRSIMGEIWTSYNSIQGMSRQ